MRCTHSMGLGVFLTGGLGPQENLPNVNLDKDSLPRGPRHMQEAAWGCPPVLYPKQDRVSEKATSPLWGMWVSIGRRI